MSENRPNGSRIECSTTLSNAKRNGYISENIRLRRLIFVIPIFRFYFNWPHEIKLSTDIRAPLLDKSRLSIRIGDLFVQEGEYIPKKGSPVTEIYSRKTETPGNWAR